MGRGFRPNFSNGISLSHPIISASLYIQMTQPNDHGHLTTLTKPSTFYNLFQRLELTHLFVAGCFSFDEKFVCNDVISWGIPHPYLVNLESEAEADYTLN